MVLRFVFRFLGVRLLVYPIVQAFSIPTPSQIDEDYT